MVFITKRLAAGDTPDAPHYYLGTREPNSSPKTPTHTSSSGATRGPSDTLHSTYATELGLFPKDALSRSDIKKGEAPSTFQRPDARRGTRRTELVLPTWW
ncbi:hypothetical protein F511_43371 [Dorcoceras hygrometricum]|uniref:Uncharacterized protein n=1 Tax=Dorcoceras hygrometricum TaxID=472368 RepID=A0A2Z7D638_9LAMI|nr:hypothetical protein F511_43371 [Dorcoceras hygrometricum]